MSLKAKCACCLQTDVRLQACATCSMVQYCSKECQKKHWKSEHKQRCKKGDRELYHYVPDETAEERECSVELNTALSAFQTSFDAMSAEERDASVMDFAASSKKIRKNKENPTDPVERWAAVCATSRLVFLYMTNQEWIRAKKSMVDFFRLLEMLDKCEMSQGQREMLHIESEFNSMQLNMRTVDDVLFGAENKASRKRIHAMPAGPDKCRESYALLENVALAQQNYARLGNKFTDTNMYLCMNMTLGCVSAIADLGCDTAQGVVLAQSFRYMDAQIAHALSMFSNAHIAYPERAEQFSQLNSLMDIVEHMKIKVGFRDGTA